MRPWRWLAVLAGAGLVCVLALPPLLRRGQITVRVAVAHRGNLQVRILCDGNLEAPPGGELRAPEAGLLAEVDVRDGQRVRRGQQLLRLDSHELADRLRAAGDELRRLDAEAASARQALERERREADYRRQVVAADQRLVGESAIPRATLLADELAARQAADRERQAQAQLDSLVEAGGGYGATGSRLALARQALAEIYRRRQALTLHAPAAGVVYGVPPEPGEAVAAGRLLATVTDPDHPNLRFRVDQPDLPRIAPGQRLMVTFSGQPERRWLGIVRSRGSGLREVGGRLVGDALGALLEPAGTLPANASVDVQVVVAEKHGVLIVPRGALRRTGEERYVFVPRGGRAHRQPVTVGLISLSEVELGGGLAAGDRVILETPAALEEGSRVAVGKS